MLGKTEFHFVKTRRKGECQLHQLFTYHLQEDRVNRAFTAAGNASLRSVGIFRNSSKEREGKIKAARLCLQVSKCLKV